MGEPDGGGSSPRVSKGGEAFLSALPYGRATAYKFSEGRSSTWGSRTGEAVARA